MGVHHPFYFESTVTKVCVWQQSTVNGPIPNSISGLFRLQLNWKGLIKKEVQNLTLWKQFISCFLTGLIDFVVRAEYLKHLSSEIQEFL